MRNLREEYGIKKPSFYRTHSFKVFISFVIMSTLLTAVYGFFIFRQIKKFDIEMMQFHVQERLDYLLSNDSSATKPMLPIDNFLSVYKTIEELPEDLSPRLKGLEEGVYLTYGPHSIGGDKHYDILIKSNPKTLKKNYYVFNADEFEKKFHRHEKLKRAFLNGWGIAVLLSIIIGFLNARRLIAPVKDLIEKVLKSDPDNLPVDFAKEFGRDELGVIAIALEKSMQRIRKFIEREKQLTRDASHELRTPVTVIKGAVELLQQHSEFTDSKVKRPLDRIERSVKDMEVLIEVMLVRAREEEALDGVKDCSVAAVAEKVVEENRYLTEGRDVELVFSVIDRPQICASVPELKIMLSNIVRNAINYTQEGVVKLTVENSHIDISDTGPGIEQAILDKITDPFVKGASSNGYGIGLSIVNRICEKYGWHLNIYSNDSGTRFRVIIKEDLL